ncbi:hypothetical protein C5167_028312 [Papaver somniferum]|nr:hypothetical protein C5167_028312 [Papaver somniferum]
MQHNLNSVIHLLISQLQHHDLSPHPFCTLPSAHTLSYGTCIFMASSHSLAATPAIASITSLQFLQFNSASVPQPHSHINKINTSAVAHSDLLELQLILTIITQLQHNH